MPQKVNIFWFRRDLRLHDNAGLYHALSSGNPVVPVFIFDKNILDELEEKDDRRVQLIHDALHEIQLQLNKQGSTLDVRYGFPLDIIQQLAEDYQPEAIFSNHDYEPYATQRDKEISAWVQKEGIGFQTFKDQVIFEKDEVVKDGGQPYAIFTPFSKKWKSLLTPEHLKGFNTNKHFKNFFAQSPKKIPSLEKMGFVSNDDVPPIEPHDASVIPHYHKTRDIPSLKGTSRVGVHLRFGTVSVREMVAKAVEENSVFLGELIWREFFMQTLWHHPSLVNEACKKEYDGIKWRNNEKEFEAWCNGQTGYPIVDAGMRELNETGFMHNRVRMITASFLVKHLLIDWRWGESYFAKKLLDYELASNNGNWQWVAGCGCDAAPYFRIFSPDAQTKRFDPKFVYTRKWVPEFDSLQYPQPIVNHEVARERCLKVYKAALLDRRQYL